MIKSVGVVPALAAALTPLFMPAAFAHDGWVWIDSRTLQLEGTITDVYIGGPISLLYVDVAGARWRVEMAPPLETISYGLVWGTIHAGDDVVAIGSPSPLRPRSAIQASRIVVNGKVYDLGRPRSG